MIKEINTKNGIEYFPLKEGLQGAQQFSRLVNSSKISETFYYLYNGKIIAPKISFLSKEANKKKSRIREVTSTFLPTVGYVVLGSGYYSLKGMQKVIDTLLKKGSVTLECGKKPNEVLIKKSIIKYVQKQCILGLSIILLGVLSDLLSPHTFPFLEITISIFASINYFSHALRGFYALTKIKKIKMTSSYKLADIENCLYAGKYEEAFLLGDQLDGTENGFFIKDNLFLGTILSTLLKENNGDTVSTRLFDSGLLPFRVIKIKNRLSPSTIQPTQVSHH